MQKMPKTAKHKSADLSVSNGSAKPFARHAPKKPPRTDSGNLLAVADCYIEAATAASTRRNFASDLRHLLSHGIFAESTPTAVLEYLAKFAGIHAVGTLERRMISLTKAAKQKNLPSPVKDLMVQQALRGIRRTHGVRPRRVTPVVKDTLLEMLIVGEKEQKPIQYARDKCLLLLSFSGALRRSEACALEVSDLTFQDDGLDLLIRRSKTDTMGAGQTIFVGCAKTASRCPVAAMKNWLEIARIDEGPIFRAVTRSDRVLSDALSPQSVALIVKRAAARIGANGDFSGHSLRAGYITEGSQVGLANWQIRAVSRHVNDVHMTVYIRPLSHKTPSLL